MKKLAISLAVLTACTQIHAVELGKSFVELGYGNIKMDHVDIKRKGLRLNGQYQAQNGFVLGVKLSDQKDATTLVEADDYSSINVDIDSTIKEKTLKLGYAYLNNADTQLVFGVEIGSFKMTANGVATNHSKFDEYTDKYSYKDSNTADIKRLFAHYEVLVTEQLALNATLGYERLDDEGAHDKGATYGVGASYYFTDNISVNLDHFSGDAYDQTAFYVRYSF